MGDWRKALISERQLKPSVLPTFFSYYMKNTAAAGMTIKSIPAEMRTVSHSGRGVEMSKA